VREGGIIKVARGLIYLKGLPTVSRKPDLGSKGGESQDSISEGHRQTGTREKGK